MMVRYGTLLVCALLMVMGCATTPPADEAAAQPTAGDLQAATPEAPPMTTNPAIRIETSEGNIRVELWPDKAPATVSNFLAYVDAGFYNGLLFHRVIDGFMIQGGGFDLSLKQKPTNPPVANEARADVKNARGTLAMARTSDINSATAQFFINLVDNGFLDHKSKTPDGFGYCVFGQVTEGMDVVDRIAKVRTGRMGPFADIPLKPVAIKTALREVPAQ